MPLGRDRAHALNVGGRDLTPGRNGLSRRLALAFPQGPARQAPARACDIAERQSDDVGIAGCDGLIQITFDQLGAGEVVGGIE